MSRYYIDLHDNLDVHRDVDGQEFENDAMARLGAVRHLIETLSGLGEVGPETRLFVIAARRAGEAEPFAAVSTRLVTLR